MRFDMVRPCLHCPFLEESSCTLHPARAASIAASLEDHTFPCHESVYRPRRRNARGRFLPALARQHCAGVLLVMLRQGRLGDLQQLAERLGLWTRDGMDTSAPVFADLHAFVRYNGGDGAHWRRDLDFRL